MGVYRTQYLLRKNIFNLLPFFIIFLELVYIISILIANMLNKYLVEFLGTMFLMFIIFATGNYLAIGAALAIGVFFGGPTSGGAFNPAVAIGLYHAGKLAKNDLLPYIIAEILGALAGFQVFKHFVEKK